MPECVIGNVKIHIEVLVLLVFFAVILSESVSTNLIIYRTCYVTLGYNKSECALLGTNVSNKDTENLEKLVQPTAAFIKMSNSLISCFSSVILCLFVGPWSDRFGRKPFLTIPVIGFCLGYILLTIFSALENLSPWYYLICAIPAMLTGGASSFLTVVFCYITDVTSESNRGLKMGVFEIVLTIGIFSGNLSSSYLFAAVGYWGVFLLSAFSCLLAVMFTLFFIPESLTNIETEGKYTEMFKINNIGEMIKCTFKKRANYDRCAILCCVLMLSLFILVVNGDESVIFLYLREKFDFSLKTYTLYGAANNLIWLLGTFIGVYGLHKLLKVPETILILIGFISSLNGSLTQGLADRKWEIYAVSSLRCLGGVLSPMIRSLVSKIVPSADLGKIFALIIISESLIGLAGSPLYTEVYNRTIKYNSAIFNYLSAGIYGFCIIMALGLIAMRTVQSKSITYGGLEEVGNYNIINEEEESEEDDN